MVDHVSKFDNGDFVVIGDDIEARVIGVEFLWGMDFPIYSVEWFANGDRHSARFNEPEIIGGQNGKNQR